jgi:hypothetical protein
MRTTEGARNVNAEFSDEDFDSAASTDSSPALLEPDFRKIALLSADGILVQHPLTPQREAPAAPLAAFDYSAGLSTSSSEMPQFSRLDDLVEFETRLIAVTEFCESDDPPLLNHDRRKVLLLTNQWIAIDNAVLIGDHNTVIGHNLFIIGADNDLTGNNNRARGPRNVLKGENCSVFNNTRTAELKFLNKAEAINESEHELKTALAQRYGRSTSAYSDSSSSSTSSAVFEKIPKSKSLGHLNQSQSTDEIASDRPRRRKHRRRRHRAPASARFH